MWLERVRQFGRAARPAQGPMRDTLVGEWLLPHELLLFARLSSYDREHSIDLAGALLRSGLSTRTLVAAALLHDSGKSMAEIRPIHRAISVMAARMHPRVAAWIGLPAPLSWRYPLWVLHHHAELGACLAEAAGVEPDVVRLIREHHRQTSDVTIRTLQMVDNGGR